MRKLLEKSSMSKIMTTIDTDELEDIQEDD